MGGRPFRAARRLVGAAAGFFTAGLSSIRFSGFPTGVSARSVAGCGAGHLLFGRGRFLVLVTAVVRDIEPVAFEDQAGPSGNETLRHLSTRGTGRPGLFGHALEELEFMAFWATILVRGHFGFTSIGDSPLGHHNDCGGAGRQSCHDSWHDSGVGRTAVKGNTLEPSTGRGSPIRLAAPG